MSAVPALRPLLRWPGLLALALTIFGARLWLVHHYGSALPFWDQWDGEGGRLVKPWAEGRLGWHAWFEPHNEHRIFFTRLLAVGLLQGNGLWDARLQMTVNALIFTVVLTGLTAVVTRRLPAALFPLALGVSAVLGALPFGWENTLGGFQNQFYLLLGFSLLVMWGLGMGAPFSGSWWVGVAATPLAGLCMAGGMFAPAVALGLRVLRWVREGRQRGWPGRREWFAAGITAGLTLGNWALAAPAPQHAGLRAADPAEFLRALAVGLGWPWRGGGWASAALMMAPGLILLAVYLSGDGRRREEERWSTLPADDGETPPTTRGTEWLLALGLLTLVQTLAVAYARGRGLGALNSRYLDQAALGVWANALAALLLAWRCRPGRSGWTRVLAATLAAAWSAQAGVGLWRQTREDFTFALPAKRAQSRGHEERVRGFVATDDFERYLRTSGNIFDLPYPVPEMLAVWLRDPSIRRCLPAVVREPLALEVVATDADAESLAPLDPAAPLPGPWFPPLPAGEARVWNSYLPARGGDAAQGELVARLPAEIRTPYLWVHHAGYVGRPGLTLTVEDTRPGGGKSVLQPAEAAHERWVETPWRATARRQLVLRATDRSAAAWFAFSAPREDGPLSYRAARLGAWGGSLFAAGLAGFLVLGVAGYARMTTSPRAE